MPDFTPGDDSVTLRLGDHAHTIASKEEAWDLILDCLDAAQHVWPPEERPMDDKHPDLLRASRNWKAAYATATNPVRRAFLQGGHRALRDARRGTLTPPAP